MAPGHLLMQVSVLSQICLVNKLLLLLLLVQRPWHSVGPVACALLVLLQLAMLAKGVNCLLLPRVCTGVLGAFIQGM